jgi:hypothetical protein
VSQHLHVIEQWDGGEEARRAVGQPELDAAALVRLGLDRSADPAVAIEAATAALALLGQ